MTRRDTLLSFLPHGVVEGVRDRRMLRRLGAATTRSAAASLVRNARLDLLPPQALSEVRTVVDVGANEGAWSLAVLAVARPERLLAVEPSPAMLPPLRAALGGHPGVEIVECAAGAEAGEATFHVTAHSHNASLLRPRSEEMGELYGDGWEVVEEARVTVSTLDELARDLAAVDLLKIDVQGAERDVLAGGAETLAKTHWLLIEANLRSHYEGDLLLPELHELLVGMGLELAGISQPRIEAGVALWCDVLYRATS